MKNTFTINGYLVVESELRDFLTTSQSKICAMITSFGTSKEINYLSITDKIDTVSYLPTAKLSRVEQLGLNPYDDGIGRTEIKVGRLIYKLFSKQLISEYIKDYDIEDFVNQFKSFFDISSRRLVVVEGEDIRNYYLDRNYCYPDFGTLWKSCMRYKERQPFLNIYTKNPNKIKMLVMLSVQDGVEKVRARALLWEEVQDLNDNNLKIMDRIYTIYDSDVFVFKKWAREHGYIPKFYQNAKTQNIFGDEEEMILNLKVKLDNHVLESYPYLDTFQFYNPLNGYLYNNTKKMYHFTLIQSNGSLIPPEPEDEVVDEDEDESEYLWTDDQL